MAKSNADLVKELEALDSENKSLQARLGDAEAACQIHGETQKALESQVADLTAKLLELSAKQAIPPRPSQDVPHEALVELASHCASFIQNPGGGPLPLKTIHAIAPELAEGAVVMAKALIDAATK